MQSRCRSSCSKYNGGFNPSDGIKAYSTTAPHPTRFRNKNKHNLLVSPPRFLLAVVYACVRMTEHVGSADNAFNLYSGSARFESRQGHHLRLLRFIVVLFIPFGPKNGVGARNSSQSLICTLFLVYFSLIILYWTPCTRSCWPRYHINHKHRDR
jgi:hypothetical protein